MNGNGEIRPAELSDAKRIAEIYNESLKRGMANNEVHPQTSEQRESWLASLIAKDFPVFVAEENNEVCGFCALTPFHPLQSYRFTVTGSIYVAQSHLRRRIGHTLALRVIDEARHKNFHTIIAGIHSLNEASIAFHKALGFRQAGLFKEIGCKDGKWYDDVCMQLIL